MTKKTYVTPGVKARSLVIDDTMLSSMLGSGDNLGRVGEYDDKEFDDLFE
jgi:hypothetical protein